MFHLCFLFVFPIFLHPQRQHTVHPKSNRCGALSALNDVNGQSRDSLFPPTSRLPPRISLTSFLLSSQSPNTHQCNPKQPSSGITSNICFKFSAFLPVRRSLPTNMHLVRHKRETEWTIVEGGYLPPTPTQMTLTMMMMMTITRTARRNTLAKAASELCTYSNVFHSLLPLSLSLSFSRPLLPSPLSTRDNYRTNERRSERTKGLVDWLKLTEWLLVVHRVLHSSRGFSRGTATTLQGCVLVPVIVVVQVPLVPLLIRARQW